MSKIVKKTSKPAKRKPAPKAVATKAKKVAKTTTKKPAAKKAAAKKTGAKRGVDGRFLSKAELARQKVAAAKKRAAKKLEAETAATAAKRREVAKVKRDLKAKELSEACEAVLDRTPVVADPAERPRGMAALIATYTPVADAGPVAPELPPVIVAAEQAGVLDVEFPQDLIDNVIRLADRIVVAKTELRERSEHDGHCSTLHNGIEVTGHALSIQAFLKFRDQYRMAHHEPRGSLVRKEAAAYVRANRKFVAQLAI